MLSYSAVLLFCLGFFCFSFQLAHIFSSGTISLQLHHFHSHFWSSLRTEKRCLSSSQKSFFFAVCQHGVLKRFSKFVLFQLVCFISLSFTFASNKLVFERCICPSRNTYISQPSSESSCNAWTMYYWLQIRVARCRRRFHLKLLLAHGFLQTFPSFIQCVNAIGSYYVKICLICSEIHIWLKNTVIFYQAFDDKYKQPRQII